MNILHLSTPKTWRGGEQQVYWLFEEIAQNKAHTQFLVCPSGSTMQQKCKENGWNHEAMKNMHHFNPVAIRFFSKICKQNKIDIVHLHDAHALNIGVLASVFFGLKIPLVFTRRVDFKLNNNAFTRFKYNYGLLKKIICVSEKIKTVIAADIKNPQQRLKTIYSGVDIERFTSEKFNNTLKQEYHISESTVLVGNTSALSDHKDLITFVEVAALVLKKSTKEVHFFLIGEGKERPKIEKRIKDLGISKHITLTGFRNDIAEILPNLTIFLMTSQEEGLGTSVLDAMAAGVAVVATNAGGLPESVLHNKTGLLAEVKNTEQLSNFVLQLINKATLRTQLITEAKIQVKQKFSKQKMSAGVLAVYKEVLKFQEV